MTGKHDSEIIKSNLILNLKSCLHYLLPNGKFKNNSFYVGDVNGAEGESLVVSLEGEKAGLWHDFTTSEGGDIFHLWGAVKGIKDFSFLLDEINGWLGNKAESTSLIKKTKEKKPLRILKGKELKADVIYDYFDENGKLIFKILRTEAKKEGEKKTFFPWVYLPETDSFCEGLTRLTAIHGLELRPLYNIKNKKSTHTKVLLVEGEKCVDAVQAKYGDLIWVTTWSGGSTAMKNSDFTLIDSFDEVYFWQDADIAGDKALKEFKEKYNKKVNVVNIYGFGEKYDVYDWMQDNPDKSVIDFIEKKSIYTQKMEFVLSDKREILNRFENLLEIFEKDSEWHGCLAYNEFAEDIEIIKGNNFLKPALWETKHDAKTRTWLAEKSKENIYRFKNDVPQKEITAAIYATALKNSYNPLIKKLDSLKWDGIDSFCGNWITADEVDYTFNLIKYWMLGAVKRAYKPGCDFQEVLIIGGPKGIGKSSFFKNLANSIVEGVFTDTKLPIGKGNGAFDGLKGIWIAEVAELSSFTSADLEDVKSFVSSSSDYYRKAYATKAKHHKRTNVFGATTNKDEYLNDPSDERRFLPIRIKKIEWDYFNERIPQLWAQIVDLYKRGIELEVDPRVGAYRDQSIIKDEWASILEAHLIGKTKTTLTECLDKLFITVERQSLQIQLRVGRCLELIGFKKIQKKEYGKNVKIWVRE